MAPHLKGLLSFHPHQLLLLAVIVPAAVGIVISVPNVLIRLGEPPGNPPRAPTSTVVAVAITVDAALGIAEIDQEQRQKEYRDIDGCHDERVES